MGNDALAHRIAIGLFYHKISMVCCKEFHVFCLNIQNIVYWLKKMKGKLSCGFWCIFSSTFSLISCFFIFVNLLLLCGDIETNPGPGDTPDFIDSTISIFHVNIRSLRNKIDYIVDVVQDFDILFFTETHLDNQISDEDVQIEGFTLKSRRDRNQYGEGDISIL